MIKSFSVIVPVADGGHTILQALGSVEASIQYFYQYHQGESVEAEIIVVSQETDDSTQATLQSFSQKSSYCKIVNHFKPTSRGIARNTGINTAKGDLLFFCDSDALYLKEHIYLCYRMLNHEPSTAEEASFVLSLNGENHAVNLPEQPLGAVQTAVYSSSQALSIGRNGSENSFVQNLCIRRECYEFIEGFPEVRLPYSEAGFEDLSYLVWLSKFFRIGKVNLETVKYLHQSVTDFGSWEKQRDFHGSQQGRENDNGNVLSLQRQKIEQDRILYLLEKLKYIEKSQAFISWLNWQQISHDYMSQNCFEPVVPLLEYGFSLDSNNLVVRNLLAAAYNNLGAALRSRGELLEASKYFQLCLDLNPALPKTDLARLNFNFALSLRDQKEFERALFQVEKALELDPSFQEAVGELLQLKYHLGVDRKQYEFTEDWFSKNIPIWTSFLSKLINLSNLKVLEVGSWEGRSSCWFLDNLLLHPSGSITCVDTFAGSTEHTVLCDRHQVSTIEQRFDANIAKTGAADKVKKMVGNSQIVLRSLGLNTYDLAYIDASHVAADVLEDTLLVWRLIKIGGLIIFDDYGFQFPKGVEEDPPRIAIDAFLQIFHRKIRLLHKGYQVLIEKIAE